MERSKKILLVSHCVLNTNSKIYPFSSQKGAYFEELENYMNEGVGIYQLPCPEISYLGMKRWGMTKEQYNTPNFVNHCKEVLKYPLVELKALHDDGCYFVGLLGMDRSPNCGVFNTCIGYTGGGISAQSAAEQSEKLQNVRGQGVFVEILIKELSKIGVDVALKAIS
jgi:predicted secreted protein